MYVFENSPSVSIHRRPAHLRRFLVFIRAGSRPRTTQFSATVSEDRNFDIAMNYYAHPHSSDTSFETAEYLIAGGLSKYHAAKHFLYAGYLDKYEGVYFLDDDVELHFDPSTFLNYCGEKGFALAQAALSHASDGAWRVTYYHPAFEFRLTNFVEVMAPYFSQSFLMTVVDAFDISISTYGLDVFWGTQLEVHQRAAIVDRYQMSHLKRRDLKEGAFYAYLASHGINCFEEMKSVLARLGLDSYQIRILGGAEIIECVRVS